MVNPRKIANEDENPFIFEWVEQYSQFFEECNWRTFSLAYVELEDDHIMGGFEITFILLGLGFRFRWNHTETENMRECKNFLKDIRSRNEN